MAHDTHFPSHPAPRRPVAVATCEADTVIDLRAWARDYAQEVLAQHRRAQRAGGELTALPKAS